MNRMPMHPQLGPRETEVIAALEEQGTQGMSAGSISRAIRYDEPNVYLTLRGLVTRRFVEKDAMTDPHSRSPFTGRRFHQVEDHFKSEGLRCAVRGRLANALSTASIAPSTPWLKRKELCNSQSRPYSPRRGFGLSNRTTVLPITILDATSVW